MPSNLDDIWQELCKKDDRTSPIEYPDMVLITRGELSDIITSETTLPTIKICIKTMHKSDDRADYFVSISLGDREVTPHVFTEEYKAAYHVALYNWLLNGYKKPDLMAFGPDEWPAQPAAEVTVDERLRSENANLKESLLRALQIANDLAKRLNEVVESYGPGHHA